MAERNVVLTEHQERVIEGLVRSGRYQDASDVLREACASSSAEKQKTRRD